MLAGPFGIAAGAKAGAPTVPLWALVVGAQVIDLLYFILNLAGVEGRPVPGAGHALGATALSNAPYSHALLVSLLLALVAGGVSRAVWGRGAAGMAALVVGAHWVLDLLLYRDLPILPGNAGGLPLLGLGLAQTPTVRTAIEAVLVLGGALLYYRSVLRLPAPSIRSSGAYRTRALVAGLVTTGLLLLALAASVLGLD